MEEDLKVTLMEHTPNMLDLTYRAARQCYHGDSVVDMESPPTEEMEKFVRAVVGMGHVSVSEHASFTFHIEGVSRALTHQLVRHRIAAYSQQSQRYVGAEGFGYVIPPKVEQIVLAKEKFMEAMAYLDATYAELSQLLGEEANEDARFVLPNAAASKIVVTMNCHSLLNFFEKRCCQRAQWEIRNMAHQMLTQCKEVLPSVFDYAGASCARLRWCPEGGKSCGKYPTFQQVQEAMNVS